MSFAWMGCKFVFVVVQAGVDVGGVDVDVG